MATAISATGHHALGSMSFTSEDIAVLNTSSYGSNPSSATSTANNPTPDQTLPRINNPSAALPDFVFPARASPSSAPSSFSRASGRRTMSAIETGTATAEVTEPQSQKRRSRPAPLPVFSFNSTTAGGLASPPQSPSSATAPQNIVPSRAAGHRRGTSELHGGDATSGATLLSTSPGKSPTASSLGPSAGRKGHSHRRSAAISSHDLSFILKPSNANSIKLGGSAPTSPSDFEHTIAPFPAFDHSAPPTASLGIENAEESTGCVTRSSSPSPKSQNRNRVGFSDTLEFIPRPLSLVSSDTSSTVRGHSVSGSLSSIVSGGACSPILRDRSPHSPLNRPQTAGSILDASKTVDDRPGPPRSSSTPMMLDLSASLPNSPAPSTPKWAFFSRSGESSPSRSRPASAASSDKQIQDSVADAEPPSPDHNINAILMASVERTPTTRRASVSSRKSNKKQKKVKSWAGSILSRKSRPRSQKHKGLSRRSPTPPLRPYAQMCEENDAFDFSQKQTVEVPSKPELNTDFATWKPRPIRPQDEELMSPIIDLDAALGPFNTPSSYDPQWDASQKGTTSKRRMHSAAGMGGFMGPGMHYHRRAESAPEMVPFDNPRFSIHRLGSSSTMADVFEEDEEDEEWEDAKGSSDKGEDDDESGLAIDIKVVEAEDMRADKSMDWTVEDIGALQRGVKRKGSGLSEGERRQVSSSMKSEHSSTSLQDEPILEESPTTETPISSEPLTDSFTSRRESGAKSSSSMVLPSLNNRIPKEIALVDAPPTVHSPSFLTPTSPNSTVPSPFPSPRSPFSYDAQRISTAPSSITDEHGYESLLLGEPGPEYRMSVDENPSVASSNSTVTKENPFGMAITDDTQFRDGQRSASFSSAAMTRKRSSMASLSRLISSSHGEKSKLSIEQRPSSANGHEIKEKASKGKRISRMMQFWKAKDTA